MRAICVANRVRQGACALLTSFCRTHHAFSFRRRSRVSSCLCSFVAKPHLAGLIAFSAWLLGTGILHAQPTDPATIARRITELHTSGKYAEALPLAERLVALAKSRYGESSTDYANALEQLAATHFYQQNYAQAEPIYQQVIAIRERSLGPSHESVLDCARHACHCAPSQSPGGPLSILAQARARRTRGQTGPQSSCTDRTIARPRGR